MENYLEFFFRYDRLRFRPLIFLSLVVIISLDRPLVTLRTTRIFFYHIAAAPSGPRPPHY
jgi:hypothetical protein